MEPLIAADEALANDDSDKTMDRDETTSPSSVATLYPSHHSQSARSLVDTYQLILLHSEHYCEWAEVQDELARHVDDKPHALDLFRSVYRIGVQQAVVLQALACLVNDVQVDESLPVLAAYFCVPTVTDLIRLACVRLLVVLKSPLDAGWQVEEPFLQDTLAFIMQTSEWEFLEHSEKDLLYRLRDLVGALRGIQSQGPDPGNAESTIDISACASQDAGMEYTTAAAMSLPTSASPASPRCFERSLGNRSRQNLRDLEHRFKGQSKGSPIASPSKLGLDTSSGLVTDELALQLEERRSQHESRSAGRFGSISMSGISLMKRVTSTVATVIPVSVTDALDHVMASRNDSSTIDEPSHEVWSMQLSKLSI